LGRVSSLRMGENVPNGSLQKKSLVPSPAL
jgi:hypothetical protein